MTTGGNKAAEPQRYRMADVVRKTGVGRETIRFYIREGLLPEPERPARNMAWYSDEHLRLLRTIRQLKDEEFLPLEAIKAVLHDRDAHHFSERQRSMLDRMRRRLHLQRHPTGAGHSRRKLADLLDISQEELREAEEIGFIRANAAQLSEEEERLLTLWAEMRDAGLRRERGLGPAALHFINEAVERMFRAEVRIFSEHLRDLSDAETDALLNVVIPDMNRAFELLHTRRVRSFVNQFGAEAGEPEGEI
ncbi:MAG: MerR family transcriptional regulator [Algiphilus sp.]|uniref:MerR family transcriptional regulator n=1 Tax=Algiphilus sp. TaxID=1872431 RepID=UPI001CA7B41D|nr:MerR family transcriptional regulator [Algiphilus sp.]MBY8965156.1 MerR family transcriptional regulator [Algiphilus acroporae]MCI5063971.1 MerR family transcriptional regulator [Algiphilus sp.]MCI5104910.1 MerR family transcriptional regulator [Algiphilus sp.]MCR9090736.1 MerR family transcriptional regulator [Pseudomonadota bacterium]